MDSLNHPMRARDLKKYKYYVTYLVDYTQKWAEKSVVCHVNREAVLEWMF